jgi:hypothetical protein
MCGCSLKTTRNLVETKSSLTKTISNTYFSDQNKDYVYKSKIDVYGKHFGGILIIKKTAKNTHRVVFTTEFGSTLFDFEFKENDFKSHFIVSALNKPIIVNTLKKDFNILLKETLLVQQEFTSNSSIFYKTKDENRFNFYVFSKEKPYLKKIVHTSATKEKITFTFEDIIDDSAHHIAINHHTIKLSLALQKL